MSRYHRSHRRTWPMRWRLCWSEIQLRAARWRFAASCGALAVVCVSLSGCVREHVADAPGRLHIASTIIDPTSGLWACEVSNTTTGRLSVCAALERWDGVRCVVGPRDIDPGATRSFSGAIGADAPSVEWTGTIGAYVLDGSFEQPSTNDQAPRLMANATGDR